MAPVRVLVADDHRLMREGTAALLALDSRVEVVALASDGREAIDAALRTRPDIAVLDLYMPRVSGSEACAVIRNRVPQTQVIVLTVSERDHDLYTALRVGAAGYLLKDMPPAELVAAVVGTAKGERVIAPAMAARMLGDLPAAGMARVALGSAGGDAEERYARLQRARARGPRTAGRRADQPRDRRAPVDQRADRQEPRCPRPDQAAPAQPRRSSRPRRTGRTLTNRLRFAVTRLQPGHSSLWSMRSLCSLAYGSRTTAWCRRRRHRPHQRSVR